MSLALLTAGYEHSCRPNKTDAQERRLHGAKGSKIGRVRYNLARQLRNRLSNTIFGANFDSARSAKFDADWTMQTDRKKGLQAIVPKGLPLLRSINRCI